MRVIGGTLKGRIFHAPKNLPTRPTTDQAKEGLFNILNNRIDLTECRVLDLFSGIGSVSLEFLSRGAETVTSIDSHPKCVRFQQESGEKLQLENWDQLRGDVLRYLPNAHGQFDVIFADPPYDILDHKRIHELILEFELLKRDGLFILEHEQGLATEPWNGFEQLRKYGRVHFSFFNQNLIK